MSELRAARKAKRLSLESLAEMVGISTSQLSRFESGKRRPRLDEAKALAFALGVPLEQLTGTGDGPMRVPLVGFVGAGAEAHLFDAGQGPFDEVQAPDNATPRTVAVEVKGDSLGAVFNSWLVYYDDEPQRPRTEHFNQLCVVGMPDGRVLVKMLKRGVLRDRYHLISNTELPIYDADISWVARVTAMMPRQ